MQVTLGTLTLASGAREEPCRLISAGGSRAYERALIIRSPGGALYDRMNRSFSDTIEADFSYPTPGQAMAGLISRRLAALSASPATLSYDGSPVGTAIVTDASGDIYGCGVTMRFTIQGALA